MILVWVMMFVCVIFCGVCCIVGVVVIISVWYVGVDDYVLYT